MAVSDTMDVEKITDKSDHCGKITGIDGSGRGVDADNADTVTEENLAQHISNAKMLSKKLQTIVAITGAIDLVTDGSSCYVIRNGNPQMGHVTGAGCQLSGILTAFLAANPENKLQAAAAAVCMMGYAGELAAEKSGQSGSGTYRVSLMDAVSCMDGGKIGVHREIERDINLQIVRKIQEQLEKEKQGKIQVILTREDENGLAEDNVKDLKERVRLINETRPDLVVSIHQNSYTDERVKGAQVFYHTASTEGKKVAELMQTSLYTLDETNHRQAKENQTYYLLKKTEVPVIIVECGFLSNPDEAEKLSSESYQDQVAEAVTKGILNYFGKGEN